MLQADTFELPVMIDGKVRARVTAPTGAPKETLEALALDAVKGQGSTGRDGTGRSSCPTSWSTSSSGDLYPRPPQASDDPPDGALPRIHSPRGSFKPAYLIHGDDHGRIAERRARLRALAEQESGTNGVELFEGEQSTPEAVANALNAMTFAIGRRFIVVDGVERWKEKDLDRLEGRPHGNRARHDGGVLRPRGEPDPSTQSGSTTPSRRRAATSAPSLRSSHGSCRSGSAPAPRSWG